MVIFAIVCCHDNSLQILYTHMNKKVIPGVLLIFDHCECQELKPKVETHSSFLVPHPSSGVDTVDTVNTVRSHLN